MANTLTAIVPSIFAGLDVVSREMIGMIPAVQRSTEMERAAVGQTVTVPVVPPASGGDVVPASIPPDDGNVVIGSIPITITKSKYSPVRWNGEEQLTVGPTGQYNKILADQFAQAFRWLSNQIEVDLMTAGANGASRAWGTAGNAPFGTANDLSDFAGPNRLLDENGAPQFGRRYVVTSGARFNLESKQAVLFKANEAATDDLLRRRILTEVMNFAIGYSAGATAHTKGTGTGYVVNNAAGYPVGAKSIILGTGTGTVVAGDIVTFAGDTNQYVVASGITAPGTITLGGTGLRQTLANAVAMTIGTGSGGTSLAFTPNAIVLAARAPALPTGGDSARDRMMVTDPVSGLSFEVALYAEYRRIRYEVALAWGVGLVKSEHIVAVLG